MAAKTPVSQGTAGYVEPNRGFISQNPSDATDITNLAGREDLKFTLWYFSNIDNTDTWTSGIPGIVAVFFFQNAGSETVSAVLTNRATGAVAFRASAADQTGYLLVASRS